LKNSYLGARGYKDALFWTWIYPLHGIQALKLARFLIVWVASAHQ